MGDKIPKNLMGEARGTYVRQYRCIQDFGGGDLRERGHSEDLGVDGRIILKMFFKNWNGAWTGLLWLRIGRDGGRL